MVSSTCLQDYTTLWACAMVLSSNAATVTHHAGTLVAACHTSNLPRNQRQHGLEFGAISENSRGIQPSSAVRQQLRSSCAHNCHYVRSGVTVMTYVASVLT